MTQTQEWCLNCGAAVGTRIVAAPGWRTPIAIAGVLAVLFVVAIIVALVQLADDTDTVRETPAAATTTPAPASTPTPQPTTTPAPTTTPSPTATATPTTTPSGSTNGDAEWPQGKEGWTVVLASVTSEDDAKSKAKDFAGQGIDGVGVLNADNFSSLKDGSFVVFAGQYDTQAQAGDALDKVDAPDAYIRHIVPN
jgi:septal ring-binding cell division protein DamX